MQKFHIITLKSDGRAAVVSTSYFNPLDDILKISKELAKTKYNGEVLFDLLLSNGLAPNRYLSMIFDGKQFILKTISFVNGISLEIRTELSELFYRNPEWVKQSSLSDVHKNIISNKLLLVV